MIGAFIYMLSSNMNLRIGNVRNYNNKILISSPSFKIGTNLKINLDVKSKEVEMVKAEPDAKPKVITKPNIEPNKEHKQDVKPNIESNKECKHDVNKPDTNKVTYEKEKVALILGTTAVYLQYGGCSNDLPSICLCHEICVYQNSNTCDKCPQILRFLETSLALFNIHEIIEPIIPGNDANALSANLPNSCDRAFNLFFIHSLAPPFFSFVVVLCNAGVDVVLGPPNRASIRTPMVIPKQLK